GERAGPGNHAVSGWQRYSLGADSQGEKVHHISLGKRHSITAIQGLLAAYPPSRGGSLISRLSAGVPSPHLTPFFRGHRRTGFAGNRRLKFRQVLDYAVDSIFHW